MVYYYSRLDFLLSTFLKVCRKYVIRRDRDPRYWADRSLRGPTHLGCPGEGRPTQPKPACAGSTSWGSPAIKIAATQTKPASAGSKSLESAQADLVCVAAILIAGLLGARLLLGVRPSDSREPWGRAGGWRSSSDWPNRAVGSSLRPGDPAASGQRSSRS
jgi:hypothetical protein